MTDVHNFVLGKGHAVDLDTDDCILWPFYIMPNGYGAKSDRSMQPRVLPAHRWVWIKVNGLIPPGLTVDHLCRVKACVNPRHLEVVTYGVNTGRALDERPVSFLCKYGHDLTIHGVFRPDPKYRSGGRLRCAECKRRDSERWRNSDKGRAYMKAWREAVRSNPAV